MPIDTMSTGPHAGGLSRFERRWPAVLAIVAVLSLLAVLPGRVRLFPNWVPYLAGIAVITPMLAVGLSAARARWVALERMIMVLFVALSGAGNLATLAYLTREMVYRSQDLDGLQLLTSSIAVWVTNVLTFALLYWQIDRGGPEPRANDTGTGTDWHFPTPAMADASISVRRPTFVDYIFLAFSTATAFSPTDAVPLTARAKLLMMFESTISLVTIVVVASRAINLLGS